MEQLTKKRGRGRPRKSALVVPGYETMDLDQVRRSTFSVSDILGQNFQGYEFTGDWGKNLGTFVSKGFSALIWGKAKGGKTNHTNALAKYLTGFVKPGCGTVYYNSVEQGKVPTMQKTIARMGFEEYQGLIRWGNRESLPQLVKALEGKNPPPFVFIDSVDDMGLNQKQVEFLLERYGHNTHFYFISQCDGKWPAQKWVKNWLRHKVDATCYVEDFIAYWTSRYDAVNAHVIWAEGARKRGKLKDEQTVAETPQSAVLDESTEEYAEEE